MSRLPNTAAVVRALFALSGNECAFPGCRHFLINADNLFIGQICHIEAANAKGQRYNPLQTDEERRSAANLLLFCYEHHKVTDDEDKYDVANLREMKKVHEGQFRQTPFSLTDDVLNKISADLQSQLDKLYDLSVETNIAVHELKELILQSLATPAFDEEKFYIAQLDSIKELKKQGKYQTVIDLLLDYKDKNWESISPETRSKVLVNLGKCYFDLHDTNKACEVLLELKVIGYETVDTLSFISLALAILRNDDDFDAYFNRGLLKDRGNINLWVAYVERHKKDKPAEEIIREIPESAAESSQLLFTLGQLLISQGKKKEGILLLKRSISGLGEEPVHQSDSKAMLATYILQDMIDPLKIIYNNFSTEEKTDFEEARVLFTEAWAGIKDSELAPARWYIVLNRGVIYKLTGEKNMALLDFQKAYDLSKDFLAFKNLLMMHVQLGNLTLAEELLSYSTFNKPLTPEEQTDINIIRSRLLCLAGKFREAIGILSSELDEESPDNYCDFVATIISIYFERGLLEEAEPWCNDLQGKFPGLAIGYVFSGFLFLKRGEKEKALKNFDQAQELFTESTPISDMFQLASGYVDLENYEKALPLFEKIATPNLLNDFSRGLVYTQYRLGNLREALFLAEGLFDVNPKNSFLAEIIANIYEESKNYDRAIEVLEQFSQTALGSVKDLFLYRSAKLYAYKRDWDAVIRLTEQINDPCLLSLENIFILANILIKAGNEVRGMDIAYVARTRYFDQSESHLKYINTSILIKKESAELYPLVVPTECAVFIRTDSGKEEVLLITIKETKGDNVLKPNDPFARQLIGKAVNDELIIHKSYGIQYRVLIIAVMDIFVYAFRESLRLFETRFAGRHNLDVFKANPGQPDDQMEQVIKTASSERNNFQRQVYELYNQKKATVGMLASLFKRNIVQEWLSLISSSDVKMISYSHNEYPFIEQAVSRKKPLIIDLTALLTMFFMSPDKNFFQLLENQYVVSQSTVDELNVFCEELDSYAEEGMTSVGYVDGRMTIQSISKEDILKQRERITAIIDWCHSNTQIKIPTSQLTINRQIRKQHAELLGDSFYDTILLAKEQEGTVVSDDATFKNLLASSYSIESFSCYQLANYLGTQSLLSKEYYQKFTFQLIIANYIFIPVTSDQLWAAFDMAGFQLQRPFTVAVKGLTIMTAPYCAAAIIFFLKKLYLHAGLTVTRQQTAFLLLHEASQKADFSYIKNLLIAGIEKEFKLLPTCKDEVLAMINEF